MQLHSVYHDIERLRSPRARPGTVHQLRGWPALGEPQAAAETDFEFLSLTQAAGKLSESERRKKMLAAQGRTLSRTPGGAGPTQFPLHRFYLSPYLPLRVTITTLVSAKSWRSWKYLEAIARATCFVPKTLANVLFVFRGSGARQLPSPHESERTCSCRKAWHQ